MKPYEVVLIFRSDMPEEKIDSSVAKFEKKIKDGGASEIVINKWGMKKLNNAVKKAKNNEGFFVFITFISEGNVPNDLKSLLNVSEEVIRYQVIAPKKLKPEVEEEKVEISQSMTAEEGGVQQ